MTIGRELCNYDEADLEFDEDAVEYFHDFCYELGKALIKKSKDMCFKMEGHNLDWRNSSGYKYACLDENYSGKPDYEEIRELGLSMLHEVVPRNADFSVYCYNYGRGICFKVYHHDCPTGSIIYAVPCAKSTYQRNT